MRTVSTPEELVAATAACDVDLKADLPEVRWVPFQPSILNPRLRRLSERFAAHAIDASSVCLPAQSRGCEAVCRLALALAPEWHARNRGARQGAELRGARHALPARSANGGERRTGCWNRRLFAKVRGIIGLQRGLTFHTEPIGLELADENKADEEYTIRLQEWLMREGQTYPAMRSGRRPAELLHHERSGLPRDGHDPHEGRRDLEGPVHRLEHQLRSPDAHPRRPFTVVARDGETLVLASSA